MKRSFMIMFMGVTLLIGKTSIGSEDLSDQGTEDPSDRGKSALNIEWPTLGGTQFWTDELHFHKWRIQRNALTGHYRLLDEKNVRRAWGTFEYCHKHLVSIKDRDHLDPMQGVAVVLMHGLGDTRFTMRKMAKYLETETDFFVLNVSYASTRSNVARHAASLHRLLNHLPDIDEIHLVAHSLGNIVIRHYFADRRQKKAAGKPDPRIKRVVMLGPPNGGARLAERIGRNSIFRLIAGESGDQLARGWNDLEKKLVVPNCEFGIIAGGLGNDKGLNPLIQGDDDFIVRVEETKLPGARDFVVVPVIHAFLMNDARVQQYTKRFLQHGYFISEEARQEIAPNNPEKHDSEKQNPDGGDPNGHESDKHDSDRHDSHDPSRKATKAPVSGPSHARS